MNYAKWALSGAAGGLVGALIWAGISYGANAEVGYLAWAIGAIVGFCVRLAAGEEEGTKPGITAVGVAIGTIVLGKYLAVSFMVSNVTSQFSMPDVTANDMIVEYADEIIKERQSRGQKVVMPNGVTLEEANEQAHYPPDVWQQASAKWQAIPQADQERKLKTETTTRNAEFSALTGQIRNAGFMASFGIFDALWFFLAAGTAYKLGSGSMSED